jgi:hypothetical protein
VDSRDLELRLRVLAAYEVIEYSEEPDGRITLRRSPSSTMGKPEASTSPRLQRPDAALRATMQRPRVEMQREWANELNKADQLARIARQTEQEKQRVESNQINNPAPGSNPNPSGTDIPVP